MDDKELEERLSRLERSLLDLYDRLGTLIRLREPTSHSGLIEFRNSRTRDLFVPTTERLDRIEREITFARMDISGVDKRLTDYINNSESAQSETLRSMAIIESLPPLSKIRIHRLLPISLYTNTYMADEVLRLQMAVHRLADSIGAYPIYEGEPIFSSWIRDLFYRTKEAITSEEGQEILRQAKRAGEIKVLDAPQAQIDLNQAKAFKEVTKTLDAFDDALVCVGSMVFAKTTKNGKKKLVCVQLTQEQMIQMRENKQLQVDPHLFLETFNCGDQTLAPNAHPGPVSQTRRVRTIKKPTRAINVDEDFDPPKKLPPSEA